MDFHISGQSLKAILRQGDVDLVGIFFNRMDPADKKNTLDIFRLKSKPELETGRVIFYVCPECGDIDCGAITGRIQDRGDKIVWSEFGYETGYGGVGDVFLNSEPIEFSRQAYFQAFSRV